MNDYDLYGINESNLKSLLIKTRTAIRKHRDQRGDDRCWLDDEELYNILPEGKNDADTRLNEPEVMLEHCKKYIECRHNPDQKYISPQREIEKLEKENKKLREQLELFVK